MEKHQEQIDWLLIQAQELRDQAESESLQAQENYLKKIKIVNQIERTIRVINGEEQSANYTIEESIDLSSVALSLAKKEVGVKETTGKNDGPRIRYYQENISWLENQPWCASFVSRMFLDACKELGKPRLFTHNASAAGFIKLAKQLNWKVTSKPKTGALFILGLNNSETYADHVGFVAEVLPDGKYTTIEGNYSNAVSSIVRKVDETSCFIVIT